MKPAVGGGAFVCFFSFSRTFFLQIHTLQAVPIQSTNTMVWFFFSLWLFFSHRSDTDEHRQFAGGGTQPALCEKEERFR